MQGWNDVETATQPRNRRSAVHNKLKKSGPRRKYRICSRNLRPRVFCAPQFLKEDFGFIFAPRISRIIVLFIYQ